MGPNAAYDELLDWSRRQSILASCSALLGWDEQTYMPTGGAGHRGEQMAYLAGLQHQGATDPRIGDWLGAVEGSDFASVPGSAEAANVREWRRRFDRQTRLPRALVEELARTTSLAQQEWVVARRHSDFASFRARLESIVALKRQEAECVGFEDVPYDALLDEFEPGARTRDLVPLFDSLSRDLTPMIAAIVDSDRQPDPSILHRDFPVDRQRIFVEALAGSIGFDFARGRLDTAAHPFCSEIGPGDCRITTRFNPRDFSQGTFGVLHEAGHGLYEQGLDPDHHGTPAGEAASLGIHESQSRLWENAVGRSRSFWAYWFPIARRIFHESLRDVDPDHFQRAINHVAPSLIRVEADEVTYNLHIQVRFDLERALVAGDLPVADLPGAWAESYRRHLGITPANDAEGCLQDIHWSAGLFGYFPTYTLGNLYAAQLFEAAGRDLGDLETAFSRGEFCPMLDWLRAKVHREGHLHRAAAIVERATGSPPDHRPLVEAVRRRYREINVI